MGHESVDNGFAAVTRRIAPALQTLRDAFFFAKRTTSDPWDFAIEIDQLTAAGLTHSDLRWLTRTGLVAPATETTAALDTGRVFERKFNMKFEPTTCFVITMRGITSLQGIDRSDVGAASLEANGSTHPHRPADANPKPLWDLGARELRLAERVIKKFKWRAENQERVLAAFQEESWPALIHDPLSPTGNLDPKRRLHDTIKCLNRNQQAPLIRFHGDGTGEGVLWRLTAVHSH